MSPGLAAPQAKSINDCAYVALSERLRADDVRSEFLAAAVSMDATRGKIGVAFINQFPQVGDFSLMFIHHFETFAPLKT